MKSIVTKILTSVFDEYINPIENYQLDVALWQGNAQLKNVTIKTTALSSHELPFTVTEGTINFIKLHFPWSSINSQPCEIEIEGININAVFNKNVDLRSEIEIKESILKDLEEACQGDEESQKGLLSVTFSKIVDNIVFRVKDVHIQIELCTENQTNSYTFTAGILLNEIQCFTVNDKGEKEFINDSNVKLRKQLIVNGLSIYLDSDMSPIQKALTNVNSSTISQTESSTEDIQIIESHSKSDKKHQLILDSFSFTSFITRTRNERSTQTEITNNIEDICFNINQSQLIAASEFQFQSNMFGLRCKYYICGHPKSMPRSERSSGKWWRFVHRCTIEKRYPNRLKLDEVIQMLKTRHTYLQLWEQRQSVPLDQFKKSHYYELLKNVESSLNLNTILFLRSYSEYQIKHSGKNENEQNNTIKFDSTELSKLLAESQTVNSFLVSLSIGSFNFNFLEKVEDSNPQITIGAWKLNGLYTRSYERNSVFSVTCDLFKIFTPNSIIFQQGEKLNDSQKVSDFSFVYRKFLAKAESEIEVSSNSPKVSINLTVLRLLQSIFIEKGFKANPSSNQFASLSFIDSSLQSSIVNPIKSASIESHSNEVLPKSQSVNLALQKICEEYPYLKMKIKCSDLQVKIENTKLGFNMREIQVNSFPIHERYSYKPETLYNDYQLDFSDLTIKMDEDTLLKPVSTCIKFSSIIAPVENLDKFKLGINITSIELEISKNSYLNLIETTQVLMKETQPNEIEQNNNNNAHLNQNHNFNDNSTGEELTKIVMNFTSKVTVCIQQVSLNLIKVGQFKILDFGSLIEISSSGIKTNFKFHDIRCNSTEKKFIDFHVPSFDESQIQDNDHIDFSQENNAVIGFISLHSGQPMKSDVLLNSPTILVDIEWIQNSLEFFKTPDKKPITSKLAELKSNTEQQDQNQVQVQVQDQTNNESSIINVKLNKPKLVIKIPTVDKENDKIEFSFELNQISFDNQNGEVLLSKASLFNNERKLVEDIDISFLTSKSTLSFGKINLMLEEPDYPLIMEFINYSIYYYDTYLNDNKKGDGFTVEIASSQITLKDKFHGEVDSINCFIQDQVKVELTNIKLTDLIESQLLLNTDKFTLVKNENQISIQISPSTQAFLNLPITNFLYSYFIDIDHPKRIDFVDPNTRTVPLVFDIDTENPSILLQQLCVIKATTLNLHFEYIPKNVKMSVSGKQIIFDKSSFMSNSQPKIRANNQVQMNMNNDLIALDNCNDTEGLLSTFNSKDYFIMSDQYYFEFEAPKIALNLNNAHLNFDFNEIMDYVHYMSIIMSGFPNDEVTPINVPPLIYDVNVNTLNVNMSQSTVRMIFENFALKNDTQNIMKLLATAKKMDALSSDLKTHFSHSENVQFTIDLVVKECYPPLVDKNPKKKVQKQQKTPANKSTVNSAKDDLLDDLLGTASNNNSSIQSQNQQPFIDFDDAVDTKSGKNTNARVTTPAGADLIEFSSDSGIININANQASQNTYPNNQPVADPFLTSQNQSTNQLYQPQPNPFNSNQTQIQTNQTQQFLAQQNQSQQNLSQQQNLSSQQFQSQQQQSNQPSQQNLSQQQNLSSQQIQSQQQNFVSNDQNVIDSNKKDEPKNYLHEMNFILQLDLLDVEHKQDCISDFVDALNYLFKCLFSKSKDDKFTNNKEKKVQNQGQKEPIEYELQSTFAIITNKLIVRFLNYPNIVINLLKFKNEDSSQTVEINSINIETPEELFTCVKTPIFSMKIEPHLMEMTMNEANVKIDANSSRISDLLITILRSPIVTKLQLSTDDENEKKVADSRQNYTFYQINLEKLQLALFSDDLYFFITLAGNLITSENLFQFEFNHFTLSFAEKANKYEPIVKDLSIHLEKVDNEISMIFQNCTFYVSPSDIADIQLFIGKMMDLLNVFKEKSKSIFSNEEQKEELKKSVEKIYIQHSEFLFLLCEDNRSTKIPFPFLKIKARKNHLGIDLVKNVLFSIPSISFEIFNKRTQKWDTFIEPLSLSFGVQNKKDIRITITSGLKFVVSMQSIIQFLHFSTERQKYSDNRTNPNYIVENNTKQLCKFTFSDNSSMVIPSEEKLDFFDTRPFMFNNVLINPTEFISPQLITGTCSLSIFEKNRIRYLSINSSFLLKNRGNIPLIYQDSKNNTALMPPKSITPLAAFYQRFAIYGKNPKTRPNYINFYEVRDRVKVLIPVYIEDKEYSYILSCKFSKKRGVIMITLTPHYIIFNHLKVPITFGIPSTMTNIKIGPKSKEYLDHVGFKDSFQFFIATQKDCTQLATLNLSKTGVTPVSFTNNYALSLKYNNLVISIKPPLIFTNRSNYTIELFDVNGNSIGKAEGNKEIFVGTPDYFYDSQINLSIGIQGYKRSFKFEVADERRELLLQSKQYEELYFPLIMNLTIGTSGILHFYINTLIKVNNQSSSLISLSPLNDRHQLYGPALFIDIGQEKEISLASKMMEFLVALESSKTHTIISLRNTNRAGMAHATVILEMDQTYQTKGKKVSPQQNKHELSKIEVEFQASVDNTCYYVVFRDVKFPQPLMITNLIDEDANENETKHPIILPHGLIVNPMSTTIFCSNSLSNEVVQFSCYDQLFSVDLNTINSPSKNSFTVKEGNETKQMSIFTLIKSLDKGCHLLIVSKKLEKRNHKTFSLDDFNLSIEVPKFDISFVDDKMKELAVFGLINSLCNFNRANNTDFLSISVGSLQIDDMFPDTNVPVAAFNKTAPFITMTVSKATNSNFAFKQVFIKLTDLTLYLDLNFISEIVHFVKTISILHHKVQNNPESGVKYDPSEASNGSMITMETMQIDPFKLNFSISSQTGRPTLHNFETDILPAYIPPINDVTINLPIFSKNNISASPNHIFSLLIETYKDSLKHTICNFLPSPEGMAKGLSFAFHQLNTSPNARNSNTSANSNISPISQKARSDKKRHAKAPVNFNQSANTTIGEGFKALGQGMLDGLTGVVTQPMYGYQEKGASGLIGGIAKGVAGIILSPAAGLIDATTGIVDGVKNSFKEVKQPLRFPRVFTNNGQIVPYDKRSAMCQIVFQRHIQDYSDYFIHFIDEGARLVGISQYYIVFFVFQKMPVNNAQKTANENLDQRQILNNEAKQFKFHHMRKLTDVADMKVDQSRLMILLNDNTQEVLQCATPQSANIAQRIIFSRGRFSRIIKAD